MTTAARRRAEGGFTLIEVIIASALLGLEMLAVTALFTAAVRSNAYAQRLTSASTLGQNALEEAKNTPYANLALMNGTVCFDKDMATTACGTPLAVYTRQVAVAGNTPVSGMSQLNVVVVWRDDKGGSHSTTMASGISQY